MAVSHTTFTPVSRIYTYKCPVYATTNRLAHGGVSAENKPIFYVELNSYEKPRKWIKRSVALLLEPNVLELKRELKSRDQWFTWPKRLSVLLDVMKTKKTFAQMLGNTFAENQLTTLTPLVRTSWLNGAACKAAS